MVALSETQAQRRQSSAQTTRTWEDEAKAEGRAGGIIKGAWTWTASVVVIVFSARCSAPAGKAVRLTRALCH